ncbi:transposase [Streptomyces sp. NPDC003753]
MSTGVARAPITVSPRSRASGRRAQEHPGGPPGRCPTYVILDNPSAHKGSKIRRWAARNKAELCFTPTNASWANPIEAHFGSLRQFTLANSTTPITPSRPAPCTATCTGPTGTLVIPTSWPPSAGNAPVSAARKASDGAALSIQRHERRAVTAGDFDTSGFAAGTSPVRAFRACGPAGRRAVCSPVRQAPAPASR